MSKLTVSKSKALISILLAGCTIISAEYSTYLNRNKSKNTSYHRPQEAILFSDDNNTLILNGLLNSDKVDEEVDYLDIDNRTQKVKKIDYNQENKSGVLIRNISTGNGEQIPKTVLKILTNDDKLVLYIKTEDKPYTYELDPGKYKLQQVYNNISYIPTSDIVEFEVHKDKIEEVKFLNKPSTTGILLIVSNEQDNSYIDNLYVSILDSNNNSINFITSKEPRVIRLAPNEYTLLVQDSYNIYEEKCISFTVTDNMEKLEVVYNENKIKQK